MRMDGMASGALPGDALSDFVDYGRLTRTKSVLPRRWRVRGVILLAACLLGGAILARMGGQRPAAAPAPRASSQAGFVGNERLAPLAAFSPPPAVRSQMRYQARMREGAEERWDTLTFGDPASDDMLFRVTIRSARPAQARPSLFVDIAKQSAEIGAAVVHATNPQFGATERGSIEWADVTLAGPQGERACLGFRFDRARAINLSGLACAAHGAPLDLAALGHLVGRLSATSSGMEAGLGEVLRSGGA
jgi:hypothetical protein